MFSYDVDYWAKSGIYWVLIINTIAQFQQGTIATFSVGYITRLHFNYCNPCEMTRNMSILSKLCQNQLFVNNWTKTKIDMKTIYKWLNMVIKYQKVYTKFVSYKPERKDKSYVPTRFS